MCGANAERTGLLATTEAAIDQTPFFSKAVIHFGVKPRPAVIGWLLPRVGRN
jgi:hypothetical protein